jgi:hypothetical protein
MPGQFARDCDFFRERHPASSMPFPASELITRCIA